jgi:hypothetical protein
VLGRESVHRAARRAGPGQVDVVGSLPQAVVGLRDRRGREGVGLHDLGPGLQVLAVDGLDDGGLRERQHVAVALQVVRMVGELRAPEVGLLQAVRLQHRAHRPVDDDDALLEQRPEARGRVQHPASLAGLRRAVRLMTGRPQRTTMRSRYLSQ